MLIIPVLRWSLMPNTHRQRDSTVELSGVSVASAVCTEFATISRRLPNENLETGHVENLSCRVELCRRCVHAHRLS